MNGAELIILSFPTKGGAKNFIADLLPLQERHLIKIEDTALAMKDEQGKIYGSTRTDLATHGLISGSLWGALTGALFFEPFLGLILGGTVGLLTGSFISQADNGISSKLVRDTASRVLEPSQSALFMLVSKATPDKVMQKMENHKATIISTSLSIEKERRLRDTWAKVQQGGALALHDPSENHNGSRPHLESHPTKPLPT